MAPTLLYPAGSRTRRVRAALAAAGRAHRLHTAGLGRAETVWGDFWAATRAVELSAPVTAHAGRLASRLALRGADAVHLASLLALDHSNVVFAAWDQQLRAGADATGVTVAPTTCATLEVVRDSYPRPL